MTNEPKAPRIPKVGEVLRNLNGWTNSETPNEPFCADYSSDWLRPSETPISPVTEKDYDGDDY